MQMVQVPLMNLILIFRWAEPEEIAPSMPEPVADAFEAPPARQQEEQNVVTDDISLSVHSALGALKAACEKLGLSKSGSKQRCFDRLQAYLQKQKLSAEVEIAQRATDASSRDPNMQPVPVMPSREAQLLHEVTHLPYAPWCSHCVMMKAVPDRHMVDPKGSRAYPTISFDLCYTGYNAESQLEGAAEGAAADDASSKLTCLVSHCSHTGSIFALPLPDKSGNSMRSAACELVRFCQLLGHTEVELMCDQEPSMLQLQGLVMAARKRLGFRTRIRNPGIDEHQQNGNAEKHRCDSQSSECVAFASSYQARHRSACEPPALRLGLGAGQLVVQQVSCKGWLDGS